MVVILRGPVFRTTVLVGRGLLRSNIQPVHVLSLRFQTNGKPSPHVSTIKDVEHLKPKDPSMASQGNDAKPLSDTAIATTDKKLTLWEKVKHEANHYWDGTKLLGYEIKISFKLLCKLGGGYELSRREQSQLTRTTTDLLRLIPFSVFVLVPFAELLLPVALKLFPNLLPSTYESKADRNKKRQSLLDTRNKTSKFIRKTVQESGINLPKTVTEDEKKDFVSFFKSIQEPGERPSTEQIIRIARRFKNDQVLDNLSRPQLMAMARYMNLRPFGTDEILRYQIRYKLLQIIKDDRAIDYEGVESLSIQELQSACASRGIKTVGASPARLRDDLKIWLDLRLRQKIPSTLLILSSTFTYGDHADDLDNYYDALLAVLSSIPDEVYNVAKLELADQDKKLKLNVLKEQDELIKEERQQSESQRRSTPVKDDIKLDEYEEVKEDEVKEGTEEGAPEEIKEDTKDGVREETKESATEDVKADTPDQSPNKVETPKEEDLVKNPQDQPQTKDNKN